MHKSYLLSKCMFFGAQKNRLIETVLLSTHNIRFGKEIRKIILLCTITWRHDLQTMCNYIVPKSDPERRNEDKTSIFVAVKL